MDWNHDSWHQMVSERKYCHNYVRNSWDIVYCLYTNVPRTNVVWASVTLQLHCTVTSHDNLGQVMDKWHHDSWHQLKMVPRKYGQNYVRNSWDIAFCLYDKCPLDKCCLDKCHSEVVLDWQLGLGWQQLQPKHENQLSWVVTQLNLI